MQAQAPTTAVGQTSAPQTATVTITAAGTLSSIAVLTQGATGLDYKVVSPNGAPTPCTTGTAYNVNDTCTVQYTFSPKHPWIRYGGTSLSDASGNLLGNVYLTGKGTAAQVSFPPSATTVPTTLIGNTAGTSVGIVVDGNGNVYFTDTSNGSVKEIVAVSGVIPASPTVNTLATGFGFPRAIAIDGSGNLFVADSSANVVKEIVAVGGAIPASPVIRTVGSGFSTPSGVAVDGNGNLYVADSNNAAVEQVVAVNGVIPTSPTINSLATGVDPTGIAVDAAGDVFFTNGSAEIDELAVETGSPVKVATVAGLIGLAIDGAGDLYVPDNINKAVYEIVAVGGVIPANPTPVTLGTGFSSPNGVAVDGAGNVFVADSGSVDELSVQTPPTITFTSTAAGTTSSDSPMILTVGNNGNVDLQFNSANTTAGFSVDLGSPCNIGGAPIGEKCTYSISFDPAAIGPVSGSLTLQDNNLNDANGAGTQVVHLAGGVASPTIAVPDVAAAVDTTAVPLSATITYDGVMPNVTGTVTFTVSGLPAGGITATCTGAASPLTCTATYDDSSLAAGGAGYKIVASFAGDTSNNPETGTGTLTVNPGTPGMTLVTSGSPTTVDTPITFKATVTPSTGTIIPTGAVSFTATLDAVTTPIAGCTGVAVTAGVANCTTTDASALGEGSYTITANLAGDTNFTSQSATVAQTVTKATPVVVVTTSNNEVPVNGSITFTATVTPNSGITPSVVSFTSTVGAGSPTAIAANCTNVSLTAGSATCITSALNAGSYTITATVPGDSNFNQASGNVAQTVLTVAPVVVLSTTDNAPTVNGPVTLTATVTPNAGIVPNGTVSFTTTLGGNTTTIAGCGTVSLVPGVGPTLTATCPTTTLQAGTNSIGAQLTADTGDTNFAAATATPITENVSPGTPVLTTTSSVTGTSPLNGSVTFTTTVTPNSGITPVGGVSFTMMLPGGSTLPIAANCTGVGLQNVAGALTATCTTTLLNAGANSIVASIAFDSNFNAASAPAIIQNVSQGTPVLSLNTAPGVVTVNGLATITATVTPNAGVVPSGTLVFTTTLNGTTTPIAACTAVPLVAASGPSLTATCKTAALQAGGNAINASFAGDSNFVPATITDGILQTINTATITLAVVSSGSPSVVDQPVTFTATLSSALSFTTVPTGTVTFTANGNDIPGCEARPVSATDQTATCTTSSLVAFPDLIVVNYVSGDFNFNNVNNAAPITQTVNKDATAIAVISSAPTTAVVNQTVTFTATITPSAPGVASPNGVPITGSVTLTQGAGGPIVCNPLFTSKPDGTATASCSVAFTTAFASTGIVATYLGDPNFSTSNSSVNQTVSAAPTTTTVASQQNPSTVNTPVTLTATVTFPTASGAIFPTTTTAPSGMVTFSDSLDLTNPISCTAPATITSGAPPTVSCIHTFLTQGNHVITATFTPLLTESNYTGSTSSSITEQVNASGATGIQLGTTTPTLTVDQSSTLTAIFSPAVDPALTQPAGTVSYFDAALITPLNTTGAIPNCGSLVVSPTGTIPNCTETMLAAGTHNISAVFTPQPGNGNFQINPSPIFPQSVAKNTTTVNLTSPTNPSLVDEVVTFTANVTPGTLTPTGPGTTTPSGTIAFTYAGSATPICSATVSTTTGVATCTAPFTAPATYVVTATYAGDTNFLTSASATHSQVVSKANTNIGPLAATPASPAVNQSTTYSVQITVPAPANTGTAGASVPTGNVVFTDMTTSSTCTAVVQSSGQASCPFAEPAAGTHTITVTYIGDGNFNGASLTPSPTVTTVPSGTTVTNVNVNPNPPAVNANATLTATVIPTYSGATVPNGTVTFSDAGSQICTSQVTAGAVAPCQYIFTSSGSHSITAMFTPSDGNFSTSPASTPALVVNVGGAAPTTVQLATTTPSIVVNQTATFTAAFTPPVVGVQPQGTVSYYDAVLGASPISTCTNLAVTGAGAIPSCSEVMLAAGIHTIKAVFTSANNNFPNMTSAVLPQAVGQNSTVVAMTASPSPSVTDQKVTFTATLTPGTAGLGTVTPTGSVTFTYVVNGGSATAFCTGTVATTGGTTAANCTVPITAMGKYTVTATYSGDTNFLSATSPSQIQTVNPEGTSVAFVTGSNSIATTTTPTPTTPTVGAPTTYSVQLSLANGINDVGLQTPTGTVTFKDADPTLSSATCTAPVAVVQNTGVATASCQFTEPTGGSHTINVTYSGDSNFSGSSATPTPTITVQASAPTLGLTSSSASTSPGNYVGVATVPITFTATADPTTNGATPTGNFTFSITPAGTITCATSATTYNGTELVQTCKVLFPPNSTTANGAFAVQATYTPGDVNYSSGSKTINQIVQNFSPTITVNGTGTTSPHITLAQGTFINGTTINTTNSNNSANSKESFELLNVLGESSLRLPVGPLALGDGIGITSCVVYQKPLASPPVVAASSITCGPSAPNGTDIVFTLTPTAPVGEYTAQVTVTDLNTVQNLTPLSQTVSVDLTVVARPNAVFVGSVGSKTTTFTLPQSLALPTPLPTPLPLACDPNFVETADQNGNYSTGSLSTFAQIGISCGAVTGTAPTGPFSVTIFAGKPATAQLEIGNSAVIAATLGAPFLLLFGLLPAFKKQRKLLVRSLGMVLMAIAILQTTGCGGGSFLNPNQNLPSAITGSYLIRIVNTNAPNTTVAEIPVFISNGTTN